jgi:hypothetical protein
MEAMLGISLYSYLYPKLAKPLCLSYSLLYFLFNKIKEEGGTSSAWKSRGWGGTVAQTMHAHVSKCKNDKIKERKKLKCLFVGNLKICSQIRNYNENEKKDLKLNDT